MVSIDLIQLEKKNPDLAYRRYKEELDKVKIKKMKGQFPSFVFFLIHSFIVMSAISIFISLMYFPGASIFIPDSENAPNLFLFIGVSLLLNSIAFYFVWMMPVFDYKKYIVERYRQRFTLRNIDEIYRKLEKGGHSYFNIFDKENNIFISITRNYMKKMPFFGFLITRIILFSFIFFQCKLYTVEIFPGESEFLGILAILFIALLILPLSALIVPSIFIKL